MSRELEAMLDELPQEPLVISSDNGKEFLGPVTTMLERRKIVQRFKAVGDVNALGVVDKAIQTIKKTMARLLSKEGGARNWRDALKQAVSSYSTLAAAAAVKGDPQPIRGVSGQGGGGHPF